MLSKIKQNFVGVCDVKRCLKYETFKSPLYINVNVRS